MRPGVGLIGPLREGCEWDVCRFTIMYISICVCECVQVVPAGKCEGAPDQPWGCSSLMAASRMVPVYTHIMIHYRVHTFDIARGVWPVGFVTR